MDAAKMPKRIAPLSPSQVQNARSQAKPYKLRDGGGLLLTSVQLGVHRTA
ncbi:hypothetical protein XaFJ1_GM001064 [Xanthomonas albilineans]|nr:hypothetical protein XaFJ1_GM001064 [Xanthomonas albilineans]